MTIELLRGGKINISDEILKKPYFSENEGIVLLFESGLKITIKETEKNINEWLLNKEKVNIEAYGWVESYGETYINKQWIEEGLPYEKMGVKNENDVISIIIDERKREIELRQIANNPVPFPPKV